MTKIAAIIGGVLLMAGVALAGTAVSLGASGTPTIGSTLPAAAPVTVRHEDRGREAELRGRANEAREHVRRADRRARVADDRGHHQRGRDDAGHRGHGGHGGDD
jgi:hypothetical protein